MKSSYGRHLEFEMPTKAELADDETRRIRPGTERPPPRSPAELVLALTALVNRKVAALEAIDAATEGGLGPEYNDELDANIERACKLAREDRAREPTDEELLAVHDRENGAGT